MGDDHKKGGLKRFGGWLFSKLANNKDVKHEVLEYHINEADQQVTVLNRWQVTPRNRDYIGKLVLGMLAEKIQGGETGFFVNHRLVAKMQLVEFEYDSDCLYITFRLYDFVKPLEKIDFEKIFKSRRGRVGR